MNLRSLSDDTLWQRAQDLAAEERRVTLAVLYHLREIERRMLYAKRGFSNLKEYCTQVLKYSESSAYRRIASMRLLREVPELDEKFKSGEITLSNAAQAQTHFQKVKKQTKKAPSADEKRVLLSKIESLSSRSCERLLGELRGDAAPEEKSRPINANETQYSFTTDRETEEMLEAIQRELHRTLTMRELVKEMAKITLKALREEKERSLRRGASHGGSKSKLHVEKSEQKQATAEASSLSRNATPTPVFKNRGGTAKPNSRKPRTRYIAVSAEREVWDKAEARCQYVDSQTHRRCEEKRHLQIEHVHPHTHGGSNDPCNLELLCPAHNRLRAVRALGSEKMKRYLQAIQG